MLMKIFFNETKMYDTMHNLKSTESSKKKGQGLKILTPDQMLSRLPITLAQLKAGNNSEKLKNEIGKLFYYLVPFKKVNQNYL